MSAEVPVAAAVDIGSNSIKMTVARLHPEDGLEEIAWRSETVRLGAGLDASGRLADDRIAAAMAALHAFAIDARGMGASRIVGVATEATRLASNGRAFLERVARETGIVVRVIDGDEEAALTFRGLAASVDLSGAVVVADVGGASTEVIVASGGDVRAARSIPLGSGRLTDRFVAADPPTSGELVRCRAAAASALDAIVSDLGVPTRPETRLIVVGGTGEFLARLVPAGGGLGAAEIERILERLRRDPAATVAIELDIPEARARVLPAGGAIVAALIDLIRPTRTEVARSGIRAGLLLDLRPTGEVMTSDNTGIAGTTSPLRITREGDDA